MSDYADQLASALAAVSVRGPTRFAWLGRLNPPIEAPVEAAMNSQARRLHLFTALSEQLRQAWYCHGRVVPAQVARNSLSIPDPVFVAALSEANTGRGTWQHGWTVREVDDGIAVSFDGTLSARIPLAECRALDGPLGPGAAVAVRLPKELPFYAPGFHMMFGDADIGVDVEQVRVYWHVTASGAAQLVRMLTSWLNALGVPFQLKVASRPLELQRCDAAVLYLPAKAFAAARPTLVAIAGQMAAQLRPRIPALTLALAAGVGLAEGIRRAESFGTHRCALLARAVLRAHDEGVKRPAERVAFVAGRFEEAGVRVDAPYLEPDLDGRHVLA